MPRNVSGFLTLLMLIQKHSSSTIVDFALSLILSLLQETSKLLFTGGMELPDAVSQASSITLKVLNSTGKIQQLFGGMDILARMRQFGMTLDHLPMVLGRLVGSSTFWTDIQSKFKQKVVQPTSSLEDYTSRVPLTPSKHLLTSAMSRKRTSDRLQGESIMSSSSRGVVDVGTDVFSQEEDIRKKRLKQALSKLPTKVMGPLQNVPGVNTKQSQSQVQKGTLDPWLTALGELNIPVNQKYQRNHSEQDEVDDGEGIDFSECDAYEWDN